jgi:hypothetical protein
VSDEYGIVANSMETDKIFRLGAKAWLSGGTGGEGWHRFKWIAHSRGSRIVEKWAPTVRFGNFRAAWVPDHLRDRVWYMRGTRDEMEKRASELNEFADDLRRKHVNRRPSHQATFS